MKKILQKIEGQRLLFILITIIVVLSVKGRGNFLSILSLYRILDEITVMGILAIGMTVVMLNGSIDLSIGSVMSLAGIITILLQPYGLVIAIAGGMIVATLVGVLNGLLVVKGGINSFIATLGTMVITKGIAFVLTGSQPIKGTIKSFENIGHGYILGVPNSALFLCILYVLCIYLLKYTRFGRNDYAIGGNELSAYLAGIHVGLYRFLFFVFCSLLAGIAGIIFSSTVNGGSAIFGDQVVLIVVAAVMLGGTSLFGGRGTLIGTFQGVVILGLIERAMMIFNTTAYWQYIIRGGIILVVVIISSLTEMEESVK